MRTGQGFDDRHADDHRDEIAEGVVKHDEARANARAQRNIRFAGDHERFRRLLAETRDRFGLDRDNARVECTCDRGVRVGNKNSNTLCKLDEIDRGSRDRTGRLRKDQSPVYSQHTFGNQRQNAQAVDILGKLDRDRLATRRSRSERARAGCQNEAWRDRGRSSARNAASLCLSRPSTGRHSNVSVLSAITTGRPDRNSASARLAQRAGVILIEWNSG